MSSVLPDVMRLRMTLWCLSCWLAGLFVCRALAAGGVRVGWVGQKALWFALNCSAFRRLHETVKRHARDALPRRRARDTPARVPRAEASYAREMKL
jgi:hypothetical protein